MAVPFVLYGQNHKFESCISFWLDNKQKGIFYVWKKKKLLKKENKLALIIKDIPISKKLKEIEYKITLIKDTNELLRSQGYAVLCGASAPEYYDFFSEIYENLGYRIYIHTSGWMKISDFRD